MESRIKQLREKRGLIQEILAVELGITQQMLSKYERDVTLIKVDILKKIAAYFNVTTDYLLGVSDVKKRFEWADENERSTRRILRFSGSV